jgi:hypothetical protein
MIDILTTMVVVIVLAAVTGIASARFPRAMRPWLWLALAEYLACGVAQLLYAQAVGGGDTVYYAKVGSEIARFLDASFGWSSRELLSMLFQQPSAFDALIPSPESNTASMFAISALLIFFFRGSAFAVHFFVTGLSLFGALSIYKAARDAYPEGSPVRMFIATVLFPSVAFWTSALHKESFALAGIGLVLAAWRCVYQKKLRALLYAPLGLTAILLFRAPALPPLILGVVVFVGWDRLQKSSGADVVLVGPVYLVFALGALVLGMTAVSRVSPNLALDKLAETVNTTQLNWGQSGGGSSFGDEGELAQTLGAQLARLPLALVNALLRPQLFDVHNLAALISALEMTTLTYMIYRAIRHHGLGGILVRIQRSPFLLMCAVVTMVGCTMVGLVTLNFGSLARYRVPFLPFYGALVVALSPARTPAPAAPKRLAGNRARESLRERPTRPTPRRSRPA